jgi:hypothetical protein
VFKKSDKTATDQEKREERSQRFGYFDSRSEAKIEKIKEELKPLEITRMSLSNHFTRKKKKGNWDADVYKELQQAIK